MNFSGLWGWGFIIWLWLWLCEMYMLLKEWQIRKWIEAPALIICFLFFFAYIPLVQPVLRNEQFIIFVCSLVVFYTFCQRALVCQLYLCFVVVHCFPHLCYALNLYLLAGKPYLTIHVRLNEGCGFHVARSHTILLRC